MFQSIFSNLRKNKDYPSTQRREIYIKSQEQEEMHKCSSSSHPCSCGLFNGSNNSFSMLFSMPNHHQPFDEADVYPITSSSSSVDCTLSLGTPSTRQTDNKSIVHHRRSGSCVSNLCWDIFQTTKKPPSSVPTLKNNRGGINGNNLNGGDPLLTRRCTNCDTTSTPLWRNGPRGPKSLCNACGIRYKKEERRATTTITTNTAAAANIIESNHLMGQHHHHQYSWAHNAQTHSLASNISSTSFGNEFRFIEDNDGESDTSLPFLSWRLNVPDSRPSLVHDYT